MDLFAIGLSLPILCLLASICISSRRANSHPRAMRRLVTVAVGIQSLIALLLAVAQAAGDGTAQVVRLVNWPMASSVGLYYDGAASLMLCLVSFVGFVVCRFSIRHLDGEARQGRYFRWIAFTIGAVSLLVIAGNLMLFFAGWVMTSFGLHQLLLHYPHRPAAHRAAWTKFAISRLGDVFLITALILTYKTFGTLDLSELFTKTAELTGGSQFTPAQAAIGWLLMLGAVTKSAQFPFHTWLPDTMETPTPVSALMHAGIVNAGGYLVIRMSPLIAPAPGALITLTVIGAVTACFAGVVMMTQSSIKRTLAYSTIAQMGFMMLQCGLGAFSAAMLHILAHSLYKAHAFLGSGSVVSQALATRGARLPKPSARWDLAYLIGAAAVSITAYFAISTALGIDMAAKPGGLVLAFLVCLALTTWGWRLLAFESSRTATVAVLGVAGLALVCVVSYLAVDHIVAPSVATVSMSAFTRFIVVGIGLAFCALFALHLVLLQAGRPQWMNALRVHAANGFYVDVIYRRVFASLANS